MASYPSVCVDQWRGKWQNTQIFWAQVIGSYEIGLRRSGVTMIHVSIRWPNDNNNIIINSTGKKTMFVNRNVGLQQYDIPT